MESISLNAQKRERGSKGSMRALRDEGLTPAVLYGREVGNLLLQVSTKELEGIITSHNIGSTLINMEVADSSEPYLVMCREIQREPLKRNLLHADFFQVVLTEELETEVPVILIGEAPGLKEEGILQHMLRMVLVACLPTEIPDRLEVDISGLHVGEQVTVADIEAPEKVTIISEPESVIAGIVAATYEEEEEEEEELEEGLLDEAVADDEQAEGAEQGEE